jgi:hypothetical protein
MLSVHVQKASTPPPVRPPGSSLSKVASSRNRGLSTDPERRNAGALTRRRQPTVSRPLSHLGRKRVCLEIVTGERDGFRWVLLRLACLMRRCGAMLHHVRSSRRCRCDRSLRGRPGTRTYKGSLWSSLRAGISGSSACWRAPDACRPQRGRGRLIADVS